MAACAFLRPWHIREDFGCLEMLLHIEKNNYRKHLCFLGNQKKNIKRSTYSIFTQAFFYTEQQNRNSIQ